MKRTGWMVLASFFFIFLAGFIAGGLTFYVRQSVLSSMKQTVVAPPSDYYPNGCPTKVSQVAQIVEGTTPLDWTFKDQSMGVYTWELKTTVQPRPITVKAGIFLGYSQAENLVLERWTGKNKGLVQMGDWLCVMPDPSLYGITPASYWNQLLSQKSTGSVLIDGNDGWTTILFGYQNSPDRIGVSKP